MSLDRVEQAMKNAASHARRLGTAITAHLPANSAVAASRGRRILSSCIIANERCEGEHNGDPAQHLDGVTHRKAFHPTVGEGGNLFAFGNDSFRILADEPQEPTAVHNPLSWS